MDTPVGQNCSFNWMDGILKDNVNHLDTFSEWNDSVDAMFHNANPRGKMSVDTRPKVIKSHPDDLVCDISSISSDARYSHPEVDKDLIPGKISQLDTDWAKKMEIC